MDSKVQRTKTHPIPIRPAYDNGGAHHCDRPFPSQCAHCIDGGVRVRNFAIPIAPSNDPIIFKLNLAVRFLVFPHASLPPSTFLPRLEVVKVRLRDAQEFRQHRADLCPDCRRAVEHAHEHCEEHGHDAGGTQTRRLDERGE